MSGDEINIAELVAQAEACRERAYAPYSGYRVGAALLCAGGRIFCGCNVENSSYGLTICAERAAVGAAVSAGERAFCAIAIASDDVPPASPCGACRQVLVEFNPGMLVVTSSPRGGQRRYIARDLLPDYFNLVVPPP
ncbi:MAG: cytidine deaminase [bacterium]|nr:cytidine deaminase [Candidatus Sumerlaeota bacterium]